MLLPSLIVIVRDAFAGDVPALVIIKGDGSESIHYDRLRDAQKAGFRYLVLLAGQAVIGFACLVFKRPAYWSDGGETNNLPQIVDLQVKDSWRGQGFGTAFIVEIERITVESGYRKLYISVDPVNNPRAHSLYLRIGYEPIQAKPYKKIWEFTDSGGKLHRGEDWIIDMVKSLKLHPS